MDIPYRIMMPDIVLVGAEKSTEPVLLHVTNKPLIIIIIILTKSGLSYNQFRPK